VRSIPEPPGIWHATLGRALSKLAAARPRAIGLAHPLPERSYEAVKPGLDRALFDGLAAAVEGGPFVAVLNIDARTRAAKTIHLPYLALLGESRLGIDLAARDVDGVARRYSLNVPTEDGGFPTLEGRLCRALKKSCSEGLIHYAIGAPFPYVPLKNLLAMTDTVLLERLFRDRIVLVGDAQAFTNRVDVPLNLALWESDAGHSPSIVVHAQTLRTALAGAAPRQAPRPLVVILLSLAALVFLMRDPRFAAVTALLLTAGIATVAMVSLRGGVFVPVAAILFTLLLALSACVAAADRGRRKP
ncbi:MAG: CHASE2 domain-containing protein, partial [Usitatibacter sp.]